MANEVAKEKSLTYWKVEASTYSFSVSLSTSLSQLLGIRFLGMDIALLGILVATQLSAVGAGALVGTILINNYRHHRKKLWLLFGATNRIGWSSPILTIAIPRDLGVPLLYLIVAVSQASGAIAGIAASDVGGDLVSRDRAARYFGTLNSLMNLAALASLTASVAVFVNFGGGSLEAYIILYITSFALAIVSTIFLVMIKDDPIAVEHFKQSRGVLSISPQIKLYWELLAAERAKWYIAIIILYTAAVNLPASLWNYYLIYSIGGDEIWITAKAATTYLIKALMLGIWPYIIQILDVRRSFIASLILVSPIPIMFMAARNLPLQIALEIYSAVWWSAWDLLTGLYNLYLLPRDLRPAALSLITLSTNISAAISSAAGSIISTYIIYGAEVTFIISTLTRISVALIAIKRLPTLDLKAVVSK
ncbi:MAG TPA: hypothetical protein VNL13_06745 [Sulfolobales archaeon]|nr:hypothetical protein [Sulfolobales archaeon]